MTPDAFARVEEGLRRGTPDSVADAVAIGRATDTLDTADLVRLAGRFLVTGHPDLARALVDEADRRDPAELGDRKRRRLDHLRHWTHPTDWPEPPPDAVQVGVIHYRQPDRPRGSKNIGDYVQTLAVLGNLARFTDVEFSGVDGLGDLVTDLQARVRPELRIASQTRRVHLVPVSRDFSEGDPIDEGTWLPAFGWHLHTSFGLRYGLPYHSGLRPLFLSFHLHSLDALDEPTLTYFRAHGPIGCRDWATVDVLLSADVEAFFTGCVTSTVDAVFPPLASLDRSEARAVGVVDVPDPAGLPPDQPVERFHNAEADNRDLDLVSGTRAAIQLLERYQRRLDRVVTSRLHAYLPATSLGLPVDFRPSAPGDARFTGLTGLAPGSAALGAMQDGLRDLLADVLGRIIGGAPADEVYAAWRARTAPLVDEARARQRAPHPPYPPVPVPQVRRATGGPTAERVDVALFVDSECVGRLPETVRAATSAQSREWILVHDEVPDVARLTEVVAGVVDLRTLPAAADLLLLPQLLPEVRRLVVLRCDGADARVDVGRLARHDLRGRPVAAHLSGEPAALVWRRAADRLPPETAAELHRVMGAKHPFATHAIGPGPLVLDLQRMRADGELADSLALAAHFGLDPWEALLAYAGRHVAPLPVDRPS